MGNLKTLRRSAQVKFRSIKKQYGDRGMIPVCVYCGSIKDITVDHIVPIYQGGTSARSNLAPCCFKCNQKKGRLIWQPAYAGFIKWEN